MTQYLMDRLEQGDLSLCCSCSLMCGPRRSLWACFLSCSPPALLASSSEGKTCLTNVRHCYHLRAAFCSTVLLTNSVLCVQYIFLSKLYKIKLTVAQPPLFNAQPPDLSIPKWCQRVSITAAFGTFSPLLTFHHCVLPMITQLRHEGFTQCSFETDTVFFS